MSEHKGYLFILFDMPSFNKKDKKAYLKFIKTIKAMGFMMALESSYYKYYDNLNNSIYDLNKAKLSINDISSVFVLKYTLNEFEKIEYLSGPKLQRLDNNIVLY